MPVAPEPEAALLTQVSPSRSRHSVRKVESGAWAANRRKEESSAFDAYDFEGDNHWYLHESAPSRMNDVNDLKPDVSKWGRVL